MKERMRVSQASDARDGLVYGLGEGGHGCMLRETVRAVVCAARVQLFNAAVRSAAEAAGDMFWRCIINFVFASDVVTQKRAGSR